MEKNSDTLSINLKLGTQSLPMTVNREDEILYRDAEKLINERFNFYTTRYPQLGQNMYLTMMALDVAVRLKATERTADPKPMNERMEALIRDLEQALQEK